MNRKRTLLASLVFGLAISFALDLVGDLRFTDWPWLAAVVLICVGREVANAIEQRGRA